MKLLAHQDKMKDGKYFVELAEDMEAVIEAGDWFTNCEALKMARQALAKAEGEEVEYRQMERRGGR